jgi:hypothetical protein
MITLTELAGFLSCEPIDIASYTRDLEALAELRLIKRDRVDRRMFDYRVNNLNRYYVPSLILQSVCEKNELHMNESCPETLDELLSYSPGCPHPVFDQAAIRTAGPPPTKPRMPFRTLSCRRWKFFGV